MKNYENVHCWVLYNYETLLTIQIRMSCYFYQKNNNNK